MLTSNLDDNIVLLVFLILILIILSFDLSFCKSPDVLTQFVDNHLILVEAKMKNSPKLWLDIKEGYDRQKTIYFSNLIMDSLDMGLSGYHAAIRHLPKVNSLRKDALNSGEFEYVLQEKKEVNVRKNYFSTSTE